VILINLLNLNIFFSIFRTNPIEAGDSLTAFPRLSHFYETLLNPSEMSSPAVAAGLNRATTLMTTSSQAPIAPNPSPQVSNPSVASVAMYYVPRRFEADSKLHAYLALKTPGIVSPLKTDYNLYEVTVNLPAKLVSVWILQWNCHIPALSLDWIFRFFLPLNRALSLLVFFGLGDNYSCLILLSKNFKIMLTFIFYWVCRELFSIEVNGSFFLY